MVTERPEKGKGQNCMCTPYIVKAQERQKIDWRRKQEKARLHVLFVNVEESVRLKLVYSEISYLFTLFTLFMFYLCYLIH